MYLAQPCANKLLRDVERREQDAALRGRLRSVRPSVDTKPPDTTKSSDSKKLAATEERYAKIEHDNRLLLQRMSEILVKPGGATSYAQGAAHSYSSRGEAPPRAGGGRRSRSLHASGNKRELTRITRDNLALLARLQGAKPVLSRAAWQRHAEASAALAQTISEYGGVGARPIYGGGGGWSQSCSGDADAPSRARSSSPPAHTGPGSGGSGGGGGGSGDGSSGALSRGMAQLHALAGGGALGLGLPGFGTPAAGAAGFTPFGAPPAPLAASISAQLGLGPGAGAVPRE